MPLADGSLDPQPLPEPASILADPKRHLSRVRLGDPRVLEELLAEHWAPLLTYAQTLLTEVGASGADDIVQEAFVRLWEKRDQWETTDRPAAILCRIVRNLALNERRNQRNRLSLLGGKRQLRPHTPATPLDLAGAAELEDAIAVAVEALSTRQREVFKLSRFHGLSYTEIASVLDVAPQTVANHMSAALSALRRQLAPFHSASST